MELNERSVSGVANKEYLLGIDIGGTFTDFVMVNQATGQLFLNKRLTTSSAPELSVAEGVDELLDRVGISGRDVHVVIHGTTLVTNALIERRGARTALLATAGHKDVLEIGTEMRYDTYDLFLEKPTPLVPAALRVDVPERLKPDGQVLLPLDEEKLRDIIRELRASDVQSVAVCLLHSFANADHELRIRAMIQKALPEVTVSLSCEVAPEIREYQRMSTTVANAYVQPIAAGYLERLNSDLKQRGYGRAVYLMLSSGGIVTHETAAQFPIRLVESGPAAGALATAALGTRIGRQNLLSFDMGGTTAKACLIDNGAPTTSKEFEVARVKRFAKGSGLPLQVPVIEMIEIGAGGGSIARIDEMGLLKVGPESAGSLPGPACYGRGGELPTVTDADLILGYLDADSFLVGRMTLREAFARRALQGLADQLGIDVLRAAQGVFEVVNTNMIAAAKMHVAERGGDPRRYSMVAFGGMGPMHAHAVARGLKVTELICPASAGVLSAWGMLVAPAAVEFARSVLGQLNEETLGRAVEVFRQLEDEGRRMLVEAGVAPQQISFKHTADMRYAAQIREIVVPLPSRLEEVTPESVRESFMASYQKLFGHVHDDVPIHIITCRLTATSRSRDLPNRVSIGRSGRALKGIREVFFDTENAFVSTNVYDRYALVPGQDIEGPAVIEEIESTAVVPPRARAHVDDHLNLIINLDPQSDGH